MQLWTPLFAKTLIPTFVVMTVIAIVMGYLMRNKDEKYKMIPIQVIACILLVLEIAKQIWGFATGYSLYWIPLHFCSLFVYMLPFMAFYKGKHKDAVRVATEAACCMLFLFMCVYPTLIYSEYDILHIFSGEFICFHTVVFHNLVLFEFVLILAMRIINFKAKRDILVVLCTFAVFCLISGTMANVLQTNYNSFYYCQVPPIENLRVSLNSSMGGFGQFVYVLLISAGTISVALVSYGLLRFINFVINKITTKKNKQPKEDKAQAKAE